MNILKSILCFIVMMIPLSAWCDNTTFEGNAPSTVRVGEKFQLSYTLNASGTDMRMGETSDFDVLMGPSQSTSRSVQIINGNVTQSNTTTYTFVLKALKEGKFTIPAARVTSDGKQYNSNAVTINVVAASANVPQNSGSSQSGNRNQSQQSAGNAKDIIVVQSLNRSSVYEGEAVVLTTKIYTRANLQQISDIKRPDLTQFVASDMTTGSQLQFEQEVRDGVLYQSAVSEKQLLIPQKSGKITINPTEYEFVVKQRTNTGGGFFGGFFDDVQMVRRSAVSNSLTLEVKPLPQSSTKTSGGVGDFKFTATVSPTEVKVDNSVQLKLSVTGEGNLKLLSLPKPQIHSDFDEFDPSENVNVDATVKGYKGTKSAEYLIIPRREGDFEIPEISFTYFDPSQGKYVTKVQGPFKIHVEKGDGAASQGGGQVTFSGNSREQVQYIGKDIRYVHSNTEVNIKNKFFLFSPLFFVCLLIPAVLFVAMFMFYRKKVADSMNVSGVKRRRANKAAMKRLKKAAQYMKEQQRESFYDEVMRALWGYLSDKLTLPLSVLTKDNAKEEMEKHNISSEAADAFMNLLDACEFARYAPVEVAEPMEKVYEEAENVIGQIEDQM